MDSVEYLKRRFPQFFINLENDPEISAKHKSEFIDLLRSISDTKNAEELAKRYLARPDLKLRGRTTCKGCDHELGHVAHLGRFKRRLEILLGPINGESAYISFLEILSDPDEEKLRVLCSQNLLPTALASGRKTLGLRLGRGRIEPVLGNATVIPPKNHRTQK